MIFSRNSRELAAQRRSYRASTRCGAGVNRGVLIKVRRDLAGIHLHRLARNPLLRIVCYACASVFRKAAEVAPFGKLSRWLGEKAAGHKCALTHSESGESRGRAA
jgi:hypothetical protein